MYAKVHILNAAYCFDELYEYSVPERLKKRAERGKIAIVPFGNGNVPKTAIITETADECSYEKAKILLDIPESDFFLPEETILLCEYMKKQCYCTFGEAVRCVMPSGITVKVGEYYSLCDGVELDDSIQEKVNHISCDILSYIAGNEKVTPAMLTEQFGSTAKTNASALIKLGYIEKRADTECRTNIKTTRYIKLLYSSDSIRYMTDAGSKLFTPKQVYTLQLLEQYGGILSQEELQEFSGVGVSVIRELHKKNAVEYVAVEEYRTPYRIDNFPPTEDFTLSDEQSGALSVLEWLYREPCARAALLFGVTGSGKTNVILKLIDKVIEDGKQVIYLVPEIALTTQTISIFAGRYRDSIAVLHSALSVGEKLDAWKRIDRGEALIVIGTRSAVFAPTHSLGLIVMDEEQESSFKSDMTPKYHARDIARYRCAKTDSLLLLASATPSVESFYKAKEGKYTLVPMKSRYGKARLPDVFICDMKTEPMFISDGENNYPNLIGKKLDEEIRKNLESKDKTVLFINRRGYHAMLTCRDCGNTVLCPHCSVAMTYHKYARNRIRINGEMVCHYCGYTSDIPKKCPECSGEHMVFLGSGTQLLEECLARQYPEAKLLRMDTDTTSGKLSHEDILNSFRNGDVDILLGTQMVTKGHDFPDVTLVGVISADLSLYLNDFRSSEKTFSLITQVLGRAGRSEKPGRAVIQTYSPEHATLLLAAKQDYESFYDGEVLLRRASVFPPYCDIASFLVTSGNEAYARNVSAELAKRLDLLAKSEYKGVHLIVFGPFEAAIYKIGGKYRMRLIIKFKQEKKTSELFARLCREFSSISDSVSVSIDINPSSL